MTNQTLALSLVFAKSSFNFKEGIHHVFQLAIFFRGAASKSWRISLLRLVFDIDEDRKEVGAHCGSSELTIV